MRLFFVMMTVLVGLILKSCVNLPEYSTPDKTDDFVTAYLGKEMVDTTWYNYAKGVENARKKARQIAQINWIPKGNIPKWKAEGNSFYLEGHQYQGLPYSSVKEVDTYVGHNVSIYTFMSALNNPKSRLYTIDLSKEPFHGVNCATYYGTVCSMSVNYALGIDAPFLCRDYPSIGFEDVKTQDVDSIRVCDIVWRKGHTMMVYDLERDTNTGTVESVTIFEVNSIKKYSRDDFLKKWAEGEYKILRYKYLGGNLFYEPIPFVKNEGEETTSVFYNEIICPDKGDRACYRVGETVVIDVFDSSYDKVSIIEDSSKSVSSEIVQNGVCVFDDLPPGLYTVVALKEGMQSDAASFEVVDTETKAFVHNKSKVVLNFNSCNSKPVYAILCKENGSKYALKQFSEDEINRGTALLTLPKEDSCYVKVAFMGKYGIITNSPILVKR